MELMLFMYVATINGKMKALVKVETAESKELLMEIVKALGTLSIGVRVAPLLVRSDIPYHHLYQ